MANLAEQTDVEASLLRALTTAESTYVDALLARASRAVRVYTGQYIEEVSDDEVTIEPDLYGNLRLPQRPVTAVASVIVGGDELDPANYAWDVNGMITGPIGDPFEINVVTWWSALPVTVTYTHGYDPIPDDIIEIAADLVAARMLSAQPLAGVVKSAAVDDVRVEYDTTSTTSEAGLTDDQRKVLDKYKQPARPINMVSRRLP